MEDNEMKVRINRREWILIAVACFAGLLIGLLISGGGTTPETETEHVHVSEDEEVIWTCPMHPQIRQNQPGNCPICGMELVPVEEGGGEENPYRLTMTMDAVRLAEVATITVGTSMAGHASDLTLPGTVEKDETATADIAARFPGRVEKLYVDFEGAPVTKGQALAEIYSPQLITAQRELIEAAKRGQEALINAAKAKLLLWGITESQISKIISSGEPDLVMTIYAPFSGLVQKQYTDEGDIFKEGETLFELMRLDPVWVVFEAYAKDLENIRTGMPVKFVSESNPEREYSGRIEFIDPLVDPKTRTADVRVKISNPGLRLRPGMLVQGTILVPQKGESELFVPKTAVMWTGTRSVAYVRLPGEVPVFEYRQVIIAGETEEGYLISEGLTSGEEVVVHGAFQLDAEAQLRGQASMMRPDIYISGMEMPVDEHAGHQMDAEFEAPEAFRESLGRLTLRYLKLKDAFVASDAEAVLVHAKSMQKLVEDISLEEAGDEAEAFWDEQQEFIRRHLSNMLKSKDIEEARKPFRGLSEVMITLNESFGTPLDSLYVQYCPMAEDNQGGYWISTEKEIRNPYFGEKMLKCGETRRIIDKNK